MKHSLAYALPLLLIATSVTGQDRRIDTTVTDARPVASAVKSLTDRYPVVVTYEDPRFEYLGDLRRGKTPDFFVPRGGAISFQHVVTDLGTPINLIGTLQAILSAERGRGGWRYRIEQSGDVFHVIPTDVRNSAGRFEARGSILDLPLSLNVSNASGYKLLDAICKALTDQVGIPVVVGVIPSNSFLEYKGSIIVDQRPAREVLLELIQDVGKRYTWQLLYGVSPYKLYALNIGVVAIPPEPEVQFPVPNPSSVPPTNRRRVLAPAPGPAQAP